MRPLLLVLVVAGCGAKDAGPSNGRPTGGEPTKVSPPTTATPAAPASVELTAVTLADDCGGSAPQGPPPTPSPRTAQADSKPAPKAKADMALDPSRAARSRRERRCEQTSMQLAISATSATRVTVKSVELLDESGASLGTLAASAPTRWSDTASLYQPWDEQIAGAGTAMVSYVLARPDWDQIDDRWNRTFTLKAVLSVGGTDVPATRDVTIVAEASLPPKMKT